ncbi:hypothetical protein LTR62_007311 [Meristemomyces frigidus]|uniref:Myb-like domain-containing protein n=1 Tax=Meristemomyces frigidus TaxID=1508187 RepID=A0AAN7TPZ0_9PEZI|nr:hypothetical protein LTR62_007311 [Meristemomyces frigidus]
MDATTPLSHRKTPNELRASVAATSDPNPATPTGAGKKRKKSWKLTADNDNTKRVKQTSPVVAPTGSEQIPTTQATAIGQRVFDAPEKIEYAIGGFIGGPPKRKEQRMRWTTENDDELLLHGLGRGMKPAEYEVIAASFPEKPTANAIEQRFVKLRRANKGQRAMSKNLGIVDVDAVNVEKGKSECEIPDVRDHLQVVKSGAGGEGLVMGVVGDEGDDGDDGLESGMEMPYEEG